MGKIKIISRPNPNILPEFKLPLHIRSAGANESVKSWNEYYPASKKPFVQIFWTEEGEGEFILKKEKIHVHAGDFFFHLPGDEHRHRTIGEVWNYRWFTMDGTLADPFMRGYGYAQTPHYAGECPVSLFTELELLLAEHTPYAQRHALAVAAEILALAGKKENDSMADPVLFFLRCSEENLSDSELTVDSIAHEIGIHRTTLTRAVKQKIGMLPGEFLQKKRLSHALSLLRYTNMPLKEIALKCGLSTSSYLCSLVVRSEGMSPETYRQKKRTEIRKDC